MTEGNFDGSIFDGNALIQSDQLSMYEVPGFDAPEYKKYLECKQTQQPLIDAIIHHNHQPQPQVDEVRTIDPSLIIEKYTLGLQNADSVSVSQAVSDFSQIPVVDQLRLINEGLNNQNCQIQQIVSDKIWSIPEENQEQISHKVVEIIYDNFEKPDSSAHLAAAKMIGNVVTSDEEQRVRQQLKTVAFKDIDSDSVTAQFDAVKMANLLDETDKARLILKAFNKNDESVQLLATKLIDELPDDAIAESITAAFQTKNFRTQSAASQYIEYIADELIANKLRSAVTQIVRTQLSSNESPDNKAIAALMIGRADTGDIGDLIMIALSDGDRLVGKTAIQHLCQIPDKQIIDVVKCALNHQEVEVQLATLGNLDVQHAKFDAAYDLALDMVRGKFLSEDRQEWEIGVKWLRQLPPTIRANKVSQIKENILNCLHDPDPNTKQFALAMLEYADDGDKQNLISEVVNEGLFERLIESPLYDKQPTMNDIDFSRKPFRKTGSETVLIGGPLKDHVVAKKMSINQFLLWQNVYEDSQIWHDRGFDYVPIEPIQAFRVNKHGQVIVLAGVLDISLRKWQRVSGGMYDVELKKSRESILKVLDDKGILHSHPHRGNFCLRFYRDQTGKPLLDQQPRLYLIDYDLARKSIYKNVITD